MQALVATLMLDWTNYLQHYGLSRKLESDGRYEPVQAHHAWSQSLFIHDLVLFNLFRHGDHHVNPQRPYPALRADADVPRYPYDLAFMYGIALIPPLFQRIVHPTLERWLAQQTQL
jgi:alkane 1-monooxygenase